MNNKLKGAEAELTSANFFNIPCLVKRRLPKKYRVPQLDNQLRKERTKLEARLLHRAKLFGVSCPLVLYVDVGRCEIFQTKLNGKLLSSLNASAGAQEGASEKTYAAAGEQLAMLHNAGISHGDSTTSNFMVDNNGNGRANAVWIFDFGLAQATPSLEEEAIDMLLFQKSVNQVQFQSFLKGYSKCRGSAVKSLLSKVEEIKLRARYAER